MGSLLNLFLVNMLFLAWGSKLISKLRFPTWFSRLFTWLNCNSSVVKKSSLYIFLTCYFAYPSIFASLVISAFRFSISCILLILDFSLTSYSLKSLDLASSSLVAILAIDSASWKASSKGSSSMEPVPTPWVFALKILSFLASSKACLVLF